MYMYLPLHDQHDSKLSLGWPVDVRIKCQTTNSNCGILFSLRYLSTVTVIQARYCHLFPLLQQQDEEHVGELLLFVHRFPSISRLIIPNTTRSLEKYFNTARPFLAVKGFAAFPLRVSVQNMAE